MYSNERENKLKKYISITTIIVAMSIALIACIDSNETINNNDNIEEENEELLENNNNEDLEDDFENYSTSFNDDYEIEDVDYSTEDQQVVEGASGAFGISSAFSNGKVKIKYDNGKEIDADYSRG